MADMRKLPPLSGEIMAGPMPHVSAPKRADVVEAVDAVYETVPRIVRAAMPARSFETASADLDVLRHPPAAADAPRWQPAGFGFWLCGATAAALAFWVSGGHALLRQDAVAASPIRVASLATRVEENRGRASLLVDGKLENPSAKGETMPDLTINVMAGDGRTTRYRLGVAGRWLDGGAVWRFSSRLDAPEGGVRSVSVTLGKEG